MSYWIISDDLGGGKTFVLKLIKIAQFMLDWSIAVLKLVWKALISDA
jgi:hypothetical protein